MWNAFQTYVQDLAAREADAIYDLIVTKGGHVFVCGDVTMAEHVYQTLRKIIAQKEDKTEQEVEKFLLQLRVRSRATSNKLYNKFKGKNKKDR